MLTVEGCSARRKRLWSSLGCEADFVLIGEPRNLARLANFYPSPFSFASQNASALLILEEGGSSTLVVDNLQNQFAESAHVDNVLVFDWYNGSKSAGSRARCMLAAVRRHLSGRKIEHLRADYGVASNLIDHLALRRQRPDVIALDRHLQRLSRAKDPDELEIMRASIRAAEAGFDAARDGIHAGMTELDAYLLVQRAAVETAGQQAIVYGDFVSGPRSESGGGQPTFRVIEKGDLFLLDFSVVIHGYRGDLCCTFVVDGSPSNRQKEFMETCLAAMSVGESMLRPGQACKKVDSAVRSVFAHAGLDAHFKHHSGHGVGLGHPDPPYIVPESSDALMAGEVVTVEPGCYVPGVGGMRFEHNYLITDSGFERLSNHRLGLE